MDINGAFRKKKGFTIAGNTLTRDKRLSLKAKGLYLLIMSYITFEEIELTKTFIRSLCVEKEKAFESIWNELKEKGYLKVYLQPASKGWKVEYELLDEPKEGAHTFYLNANGQLSCTNIDRENNRKNKDESHIPQKGSNAECTNGEEGIVENPIAKGGNNIKLQNNTSDNTFINNPSFIPLEGMDDEQLAEHVEEEIDRSDGIPYEYCSDIRKMTFAIRYLVDWDSYYPSGYADTLFQQTFNLAVEALIEMACDTEVRTYNKRRITYANVIDKINQAIKGQECKSIHNIIESAVEDYIGAASKEEIKYPRNYIKSCIFENFDTHYVKFGTFFNRTYYAGIAE